MDTVSVWRQVPSDVDAVTSGVDAVRQRFRGSGSAAAGPGVTVPGYTLAFAEAVVPGGTGRRPR